MVDSPRGGPMANAAMVLSQLELARGKSAHELIAGSQSGCMSGGGRGRSCLNGKERYGGRRLEVIQECTSADADSDEPLPRPTESLGLQRAGSPTLGAGGAYQRDQPRAEACPPLACASCVFCTHYLIRRPYRLGTAAATMYRRKHLGSIPELLSRNTR